MSIDHTVWDPPLVRQALDELLKRYPMFDLVGIDWQVAPEVYESHYAGAWVLVKLGQPSESFDEGPAWAIWTFAIFKRTGALHTVTDGAASDDPIWTP
jgi:hypothetical protein